MPWVSISETACQLRARAPWQRTVLRTGRSAAELHLMHRKRDTSKSGPVAPSALSEILNKRARKWL